jgi:biotin synthase-like enzyme
MTATIFFTNYGLPWQIITTRSYDERLETISHAQGAGISVCSGGIIGLGETKEDRVGMLHTLSTLTQHPESVPINALLAVEGTPLEKQEVCCFFILFFGLGVSYVTIATNAPYHR